MMRPKIGTDILTIVFFLFLIAVTFAYGKPLTIFLLVLALTFHEVAHLLFAEILGYQAGEFKLTPLGGSLTIDPLFEINPDAELVIAAAGPFINLLMAAGVLYLEFLGITNPYLDCWRQWNWLLGIINLIPAIPLDGGRILHAGLKKIFSVKVASIIAVRTGQFIGSLILSAGMYKFFTRQSGIIYIVTGIFIIYQSFTYQSPKLDRFWRMSEKRKRILNEKGFVVLKPVLVKPETLVRNILRRYGGDELLLFILRDSGTNKVFTEDDAWELLLNKGYNATFENLKDCRTNLPK